MSYIKNKEVSKLIALDTLQQVWNKKFIPAQSVFISIQPDKVENISTQTKWKELIKQNNDCEVCAIGALAASSILKHNGIKCDPDREVSYYNGTAMLAMSRVVNRLKRYFLKEEVIGMEVCFETGLGAFSWYTSLEDDDEDYEYKHTEKRNIIKNYKLSKAQVKFIDDSYNLGKELDTIYKAQYDTQPSLTLDLDQVVAHDKLLYIMKNILMHDGYFKPTLVKSIL